ncbi:endonuclease III [Gudongella sp. SC589]|uniref:endonuclease III n=1 Tax=Gudongella sp. SC589 TaxID=3385990 RepID=UPI00390497E4
MRKRLTKKEKLQVLDILEELYPNARAELNFRNPFELLIATILSAQCTDVRVNKVTEKMFVELKAPMDYIALGEEALEGKIRSCGLSKSKSKNIIGACEKIVSLYDGKVPGTIEDLMTLPGVGRKTANVVASNAFGIPAIAVDTHVFRVSNRIGLAASKNVEGTEEDLMKAIPKDRWTRAHHQLIFHGRRVCKARKPICEECQISACCLYYINGVGK